MIDTLPTLVGDVFSVFSLPGGGLAGEALKSIFKKRADSAREIILEELSRGNVRLSETDAEESAMIVYRYLRAAQEGAARMNLRLLAQTLAGQARLGLVKADEFLYYADMLTSLRRDEILLIGQILHHWNAAEHLKDDPLERMKYATGHSREALVPEVFVDDADFRANADALRRTGLLLIQATAGGGDRLGPSPLLFRLAKLVDFDAARD